MLIFTFYYIYIKTVAVAGLTVTLATLFTFYYIYIKTLEEK